MIAQIAAVQNAIDLLQEKEAENKRLRAALELTRDNLSSLMNAYPDQYPRHAFQGTYDAVCKALEEG